MSDAESRAIGKVVAMFPGPSGEIVRQALSDRLRTVSFPSNPIAQAAVNEVYKARKQASLFSPSAVPVTIGLVDALPGRNLASLIVRQTNPVVMDYILLPRSGATKEALASAMTALMQVRRRVGDYPPSDARIVVRSAQIPASWAGTTLPAKADHDLKMLEAAAARDIPTIGHVPAIEVLLPPAQRGLP